MPYEETIQVSPVCDDDDDSAITRVSEDYMRASAILDGEDYSSTLSMAPSPDPDDFVITRPRVDPVAFDRDARWAIESEALADIRKAIDDALGGAAPAHAPTVDISLARLMQPIAPVAGPPSVQTAAATARNHATAAVAWTVTLLAVAAIAVVALVS